VKSKQKKKNLNNQKKNYNRLKNSIKNKKKPSPLTKHLRFELDRVLHIDELYTSSHFIKYLEEHVKKEPE
jgi:hypothetical protein